MQLDRYVERESPVHAADARLKFVAEVFPRTLIMDGGQIIADGPTEMLLADEALLEAHGLEKP